MRTLLTTTALLLCVSILTACHSHPCVKCGAMNNNPALLRHVVVFKFKPDATEAQIQEIVDAFAELPSQIDTIVGFEHGKNISTEGKDAGFHHVFIVTFKDKAGLDAYIPHAAHTAFVAKLKPSLQEAFVVDYFAQ